MDEYINNIDDEETELDEYSTSGGSITGYTSPSLTTKSKKEKIHDMWEFDFFKMPTNEVMRLAEKQYKLELNKLPRVELDKKYFLIFEEEEEE